MGRIAEDEVSSGVDSIDCEGTRIVASLAEGNPLVLVRVDDTSVLSSIIGWLLSVA